MVELEALAVCWAIRKCHLYLAGLPSFTVYVDHKPLQPLFNEYLLNKIENPRVLNCRLKLLDYNFKVEWKAGNSHQIPDALSRAPVDDPTEEELSEDVADTLRVGAIAKYVSRSFGRGTSDESQS